MQFKLKVLAQAPDNSNRVKRGFTLVELLIVIIIIAVLAAVAIPKFQHSSERSREVALRRNLSLLRGAVEKFHNDCNGWPVTLNDLAATTAPPNCLNSGGNLKVLQAARYQGPYLISVPTSPIQSGSFVYVDDNDGPKPIGTVLHTPGVALDGSNFEDW